MDLRPATAHRHAWHIVCGRARHTRTVAPYPPPDRHARVVRARYSALQWWGETVTSGEMPRWACCHESLNALGARPGQPGFQSCGNRFATRITSSRRSSRAVAASVRSSSSSRRCASCRRSHAIPSSRSRACSWGGDWIARSRARHTSSSNRTSTSRCRRSTSVSSPGRFKPSAGRSRVANPSKCWGGSARVDRQVRRSRRPTRLSTAPVSRSAGRPF